jgi:hypothetical protein
VSVAARRPARRPGANHGFPKCFTVAGIDCHDTFAEPLIRLPRHASLISIRPSAGRLYAAPLGAHQEERPRRRDHPYEEGRRAQPLLTGFVAPVVAVDISDRTCYAGDLVGTIEVRQCLETRLREPKSLLTRRNPVPASGRIDRQVSAPSGTA